MDIGTSQRFAITLETTSIERVSVRAQANPEDTNNNNMLTNSVQLDTPRMDGVTTWESSNSRSDVVIEDVRILPSQITKDITIAMVETDPGNVDFGVYFDQYSLRNSTAFSSQLSLQLMDTRSQAAGTGPLLNSPYRGFSFTATEGGVSRQIDLQSDAIDAAQTYVQLAAAFQAAIDALVPPVRGLTASVGDAFTVSDTKGGTSVTGQEIKISTPNAITFSTPASTSGWILAGRVPPSSGLHSEFSTGLPVESKVPVTAKIILDDVGRGSTGGDLVVGGLSVGDTSESKGVQRFEIEVRDNSKVQTINSTNNTLQEVSIVNGTTTSQGFAYVTTVPNSGNLTVNGSVTSNVEGDNAPLPGTAAQHNQYGFSDVRLIDASKMTGKLAFTAEFSERAVDKYLDLVDVLDPKADTVAVVYTGGTGADTMVVTLDAKAVASNSNINVGREDFTFSFNGGAGNDIIDVAVDRTINLVGNNEAWYTNQSDNDNISIDGGAGDDTIRTPGAGDMNIAGGLGNDTIYADNTGAQAVRVLDKTGTSPVDVNNDPILARSKAVFVFNTAVQGSNNASQDLYDLLGASRTAVGSYGASVTVNFKGLTATVALQDTSDYKLSDLEVNQGIKSAINGNAVLSKLLSAADGPSGTLVVTSLIDGVMGVGDLSVALSAPVPTIQAVLTGYTAANGGTVADITNNLITLSARYQTQMANDETPLSDPITGDRIPVDIVGAASETTSDNVIDGGAGNDVIVLGTTEGADPLGSSNDTVVFAGTFGNDVIVNFDVSGPGLDILNLRALGGRGASFGVGANIDGSITIGSGGAPSTTTYSDSPNTASKEVFISVSGRVGSVYQIVDGAAPGDQTITLVGTITLDTGAPWSGLTGLSAANFA